MSYHHIITIEDGKRGGKPCIRGMRITVYDILSYLSSGMTYEEILTDFPYLTKEDILACLSYAEEISTQAIIEFDSYSKFKAVSKQGNIDKGLMLLDKLDNLT